MRALLLVTVLAGCSAASAPSSPVLAPPVQSAAQSAAQSQRSEAQASTRDSSATRDQIRGVQGRLARDGFYTGPIDGVWGPATAAAVSKYQAAHNLAVTGKLNTETLDSFTPP